MRQFGLLLAAALIGAAGCSNSLGPARGQVAQDLVGSWGEQPSSDPESRFLTMTVHDTVVSGSGNWANATMSGTLTIAGYIADSMVVLHLAQDDGESVTLNGRLETSRSLTGTISGTGAQVSVEFDKLQVDPPGS